MIFFFFLFPSFLFPISKFEVIIQLWVLQQRGKEQDNSGKKALKLISSTHNST